MNINVKFDYNSIVILSYFFISLLALFLNYISKGKSNKYLFCSYRSSPFNPFTYLRLITHAIGHQDWNHFVSNFLYILLIGPMIEEKYGSINLLIMFIITSIIIGIYNDIVNNCEILGASGNVYMLIVLSSFSNISSGKIPLTLILIFLFYIIDEIRKGIFNKGKVYHEGHLMGALCGLIFGFIFLHFSNFSDILSLIGKK